MTIAATTRHQDQRVLAGYIRAAAAATTSPTSSERSGLLYDASTGHGGSMAPFWRSSHQAATTGVILTSP